MKVSKSKTLKTAIHIMICLCMILSTLSFNVFAEGEVTPLSSFAFTQDNDAKTVTLNKYNNGSGATVVVPGTYNIDGTDYAVIIDSETTFKGNTSITSVTINEGVTFKDNTMAHLFDGCKNLASVDLGSISTAGVTDMSYMFSDCAKLDSVNVSSFDTTKVTDMTKMFYNCSVLKSLDLSSFEIPLVTTMLQMFELCKNLGTIAGLEDFNPQSLINMGFAFCNVNQNMTNENLVIDLSSWDLSKINENHHCFQWCGAKEIKLPDNLSMMGGFFLSHASIMNVDGTSFTIPSGVKRIGYAHTFYNMATNAFTEFEVADGNTNFKTVDGVLYSADGTKFLGMPRGKTFENDTYEILEGVTFLPECVFSRNMNLQTLVLPDSYVFNQLVPVADPQYRLDELDADNINGDMNSLSMATYLYTGITGYEVKDTNPNYASKDGILYSKDMTTLLAIPVRYDKVINVPEGVTTWEEAAGCEFTQYFVRCPGVNIPASMTSITYWQRYFINLIESRNGKTYNLITSFDDETSASKTTTYTYDFTINVHPDNPVYMVDANGQIKAYAITGNDITLSQDTYVYDGTAKEPTVTVKLNNVTLKEGTDYSVAYSDNTNPGTATVTVTGLNGYSTYNATKTFTIGGMDAQIGDNYYPTLADAVTAANAMGGNVTITLINDSTFNEEHAISNNITIDGGNHTLTRGDAYTGELFNVDSGAKLTLKGGAYSEDVDEYCATGYTAYPIDEDDDGVVDIYKVIKLMTVEYEDVTPLGTEGEKLYNINLVTTEGDTINRLNSVDLTFEFDKENDVTYEIIRSNDEIEINPVENSTTRYEFHYNGKDGVTSDTANKITLGQVRFTGYGKFTFSVDESVDTNVAHATTLTDNIVESFTAVNGIDSSIVAGEDYLNIENVIEDVINLPLRNLAINVTFPNNVEFNSDDYQKMAVKVTGGLVDHTFNLGDTSKTETPDDDTDDIVFGPEKSDYTLTAGTVTIPLEETGGASENVTVNAYTLNLKLPVNTTYTVEITGDGYRTARYGVALYEDKVLNFWNNVMDTERVIENDRDSSKVQHNFLAGDIVEDNDINIYDLSAVVSYFAKSITDPAEYDAYVKYDLNRDGIIDSKDVAYVLVSWGN